MKTIYTLILAIVLISSSVFAQAPNKMSYQTLIRNSANELVRSQNIGIRITIVQGSINGDAVYAETHTVKTNDNGLVSIEIGGGTVINGNFEFIDWSKSNDEY